MARNHRTKRAIPLNIGTIAMFFVFAYFGTRIFFFFTDEKVSFYEVTQKSIADDNVYTGVIVRQEELITTPKTGYINYYVGEGERISKNTNVYSVDDTADIYDLISANSIDYTLSKEDIYEVRQTITNYKSHYDGLEYNQVYDFKYEVENSVLNLTYENRIATLKKLQAEQGITTNFDIYKSNKSGTISYVSDKLVGLTKDQVTGDIFANLAEYKEERLRTTEQKESNSPVYKLVTDEKWSVIILLTPEQHNKLVDRTKVNVTFLKDKREMTASVTLFEQGGQQYAELVFDKFMIQYITNRFIDLELSMNHATGLKIPVASITQKAFYKIPLKYFTKGGNKNSYGITKLTYKENGETDVSFIQADRYHEDEEYGYIDTAVISAGDIIINLNDTNASQEKFTIGETLSLTGVYNVNKGYPVFRLIEVEYENAEYCIVKKGTPNGLNVYDRIILNIDLAKEKNYIVE